MLPQCVFRRPQMDHHRDKFAFVIDCSIKLKHASVNTFACLRFEYSALICLIICAESTKNRLSCPPSAWSAEKWRLWKKLKNCWIKTGKREKRKVCNGHSKTIIFYHLEARRSLEQIKIISWVYRWKAPVNGMRFCIRAQPKFPNTNLTL